jgi:hypothetical protein
MQGCMVDHVTSSVCTVYDTVAELAAHVFEGLEQHCSISIFYRFKLVFQLAFVRNSELVVNFEPKSIPHP